MKFKRTDGKWHNNGAPFIWYTAQGLNPHNGLRFYVDYKGVKIRTPYPGGAPLITSGDDAMDIATVLNRAALQYERLKRGDEVFDMTTEPECVLRESEGGE